MLPGGLWQIQSELETGWWFIQLLRLRPGHAVTLHCPASWGQVWPLAEFWPGECGLKAHT